MGVLEPNSPVSSLEFRNLLAAGDVKGLMACWSRLFPSMPRPETLPDAEFVMHRARTEAGSLPGAARLYSHKWLTERGLPSGLPGEMLPVNEQRGPSKIVTAVGISVNTLSEALKPAADEIRRAQEIAVEECYAAGDKNPDLIRLHMEEAYNRVMKSLFGKEG